MGDAGKQIGSHPVVVIGAGVIGVATAYELLRCGYPTILVEAREGVSLETSYANGALLTPGMSDPWNAPGVYRTLLSSLVNPRSPLKLRLSAVPSLPGWGMQFLRSSSVRSHEAATRANFLLGDYSVSRTHELRDKLGLEYDSSSRGTLKVFRNRAAMAGALATAEKLRHLGLSFEVAEAHRAVEIEPALSEIRELICGALYFPGDGSGDACKFSRELAAAFVSAGGLLRTGVRADSIAIHRGKVIGIESTIGHLSADRVVIAAGNSAVRLAATAGVRLPIRPVKGYTITFDVSEIDGRPNVPVIDDALHAAVVPLGKRLRVVGTAEFAGMDLSLRPERVDALWELLVAVYPAISAQLDRSMALVWAGLRPMSADGSAFVGATSVQGLYVNAGHGHLGWTLAAGSARLLADLIAGKPTDLDPAPYSLLRSSRSPM